MKEIGKILERNGFEIDPASDTRYTNEKCIIDIMEDHYEVTHYDIDFLEWLTWYSESASLTALMGYLSWMGFIERGYSK